MEYLACHCLVQRLVRDSRMESLAPFSKARALSVYSTVETCHVMPSNAFTARFVPDNAIN